MRRLTAWGLWSMSWIFMNYMMASAGMILYKNIGGMIFECILSCISACIFLNHPALLLIGLIYLIARFFTDIGIVSGVSLGMAVLLLVITHMTKETTEN